MRKNPKEKKKKKKDILDLLSSLINHPFLLTAIATIAFVAIVFLYLFSKFENPFKIIFAFIPLLIGVIFENYRNKIPKDIILRSVVYGILFSLVVFIPGKNVENFKITSRLEVWPFAFVIVFAIYILAFHDNKYTKKIDKLSPLTYSLGMIYIFITFGHNGILFHKYGVFLFPIFVTAVILSIYFAFYKKSIKIGIKVILSVWYSIASFILSGYYFYEKFINFSHPNNNWTDNLITSVEYFLLGISTLYFIQNTLLITSYFTESNNNENSTYVKHARRFSDISILYVDLIILIVFSTITFVLNNYFNVMSPLSAIWSVLIFYPLIISLKNKLIQTE